MISVAVDANGGARGLEVMVAGAAQASLEDRLPPGTSGDEILLVGDERRITERLSGLRYNPERLSVVHAGAETSILAALRLAAEGRAAAVVTAGPAGPLIEAARSLLRPLPGVPRPALSAVYPTALRHGKTGDPFALLLDVGVSLEAETDDLIAFAGLGAAYARAISHNPRPRVALLSVGRETSEAPPQVAAAAERLARLSGIEFVGVLEAVEIPKGAADVIVTNGFAGNTVIKLLDGVRTLVLDLAGYAAKERLLWRAAVGMLSGVLSRVKEITDWEQYGGAPLLGYSQVILRAHPQSNAHAIENACRVAAKAVAADIPASFAAICQESDLRVSA